jgi:two-component sensor histidine kinase
MTGGTSVGRYLEVGSAHASGDDAATTAARAARRCLSRLRVFRPSLVTVFASARYDPDVVAGAVAEVVGECPMVGTSSAGEFCGGPLSDSIVVSILASPHLSAQVGVGERVSWDWQAATRAALPQGRPSAYFRDGPKVGRPLYFAHPASGLSPLFVLAFAPGKTLDHPSLGHEIQGFLKRGTLGRVPIVGGSSSTADLSLGNFQIANGMAYRDAVVLAVVESDLLFGVGVAHGFKPTKRRAVITRAEGHVVHEIDDRPAADACADLMGVDAIGVHDQTAEFARSPFGAADVYGEHHLLVLERALGDGSVQFAPNMEGMQAITVMEMDPEKQLAAAREAVSKAIDIGHVQNPAAVLLFACSILFGDEAQKPMVGHSILEGLADRAAVAGFQTFGEYGLSDEGLPIYCNQSVVALVIGDALDPLAAATRRNANALEEIEAELEGRTRELGAVRAANAIVLDGENWPARLGQYERIIRDLTGAHYARFRVDPMGAAGAEMPVPSRPQHANVAVLPLTSMGRTLGFLEIEGDTGLLSMDVAGSICDLVARALHRVVMERTIAEQAREIETVNAIAREIVTADNNRSALTNIAKVIEAHVGARGFSLWLEGDAPELVGWAGDPDGLTAEAVLASTAMESRVIERTTGDDLVRVVVPLLLKERANGALVLRLASEGGPLGLAFLNYLSMPLAVMAEMYVRYRESNVAREMHHRVKNNLQIIASLLNLQLRRLSDPSAREALESSIRRIMSISVVHEVLSERQAGLVDPVLIVQTVAEFVVRAMTAPNQVISVSVEGQPGLELNSQQATNVAVVASELLGNALKHGLCDREEGRVTIRLGQENGSVTLLVCDDGCGPPVDFDLSRDQGLGLQLIGTIVGGELRGSMAVRDAKPGMEARITFPREPVQG